jgi:hypothetical protein
MISQFLRRAKGPWWTDGQPGRMAHEGIKPPVRCMSSPIIIPGDFLDDDYARMTFGVFLYLLKLFGVCHVWGFFALCCSSMPWNCITWPPQGSCTWQPLWSCARPIWGLGPTAIYGTTSLAPDYNGAWVRIRQLWTMWTSLSDSDVELILTSTSQCWVTWRSKPVFKGSIRILAPARSL